MYPKTGELPNGGLVTMSMRRAILAAATAAVAVGLALTGCGPASPPSGGTAPSADGIGPITFAVGSDDAPVFSQLIKPWNKAHPDQQVTLVLLPEAENGQLRLTTTDQKPLRSPVKACRPKPGASISFGPAEASNLARMRSTGPDRPGLLTADRE